MVITGATGFIGGQLVRQLRKEYRVYALGRRSPRDAGGVEGPGIRWFQVDIGNLDRLREVFRQIQDEGGAHQLLHMAAYYDFTGEESPEYERTNVLGTRNVLELSEPLKLRQFIFASSVAACTFPGKDEWIDEATPPSSPFAYARSKMAGETMMREASARVPTRIVRVGAAFSDWCEYEPLEEFLKTWTSNEWNARVLGGRGDSSVPYLHVDDLLSFFLRVVEKVDQLDPAEVLIASPEGATSHAELYREVTRCAFGRERTAVRVPRLLAGPGIALREWWGRRRGHLPFERSWMADYIDLQLRVKNAVTRRRLDWAPNPALHVLARAGVLVTNMRDHPDEWKLRSRRKRFRPASPVPRSSPG
jgi:nucleoside-diphosphate-sugar epimerase